MEEPGRFAAFRLALALGHPDPEALMQLMPGRLVQTWTAFLAMHDSGMHFDIGDPDQAVYRSPQGIYNALKDHLTNGI